MLLVILFFSFSAAASSGLTWKTGTQTPSLPPRLSAETLQYLIDRVIASPDGGSAVLVFALQQAGNESDIENIAQKIKEMPEPATVAELAARVQLHLALDKAKPQFQLSRVIKQDVQALKKAWTAYLNGSRVVAEDASLTARALFSAGQSTGFQDTGNGLAVLQFIEKNLVGPQGAWHHFDPQAGTAAMDGQLSDNAALGLAFYAGYQATGDRRWLNQARRLADFIVNRLYDRKLAGFFYRNSSSSRFYVAKEQFVAKKPLRSNGMAALFLLHVGRQTGEVNYREAAAKSIAALQDRALLAHPADIIDMITTYQALLEDHDQQAVSARGLQKSSFGIIMILSFFAGILGFLSPCTLPVLPAYFAFASQSGKKTILMMTIAFFLGLALVFSLMGATATILGALLGQYHEVLLRAGGMLIILFGLASLLGKGFSGVGLRQRPMLGLAGSFVFGMTFSVGWTACIGPILGVMLVMAATATTAWSGALSLFVFALGLSFPLMILSLYLRRLDRNGRFWRLLKGKGWEVSIAGHPLYFHTTGMISSLIFITLGMLMLTGYLTWLNRIFPTEIQAWFSGIEDSMASFLGG